MVRSESRVVVLALSRVPAVVHARAVVRVHGLKTIDPSDVNRLGLLRNLVVSRHVLDCGNRLSETHAARIHGKMTRAMTSHEARLRVLGHHGSLSPNRRVRRWRRRDIEAHVVRFR